MTILVDRAVHSIVFTEGDLIVKTIEAKDEMVKAYQLRHRVFAERLKWVPERTDRLEADVYDAWSTSIGVFNHRKDLLGLVRMTHAPVPFMLESEFSACLVGRHQVRKETDTAEITRLAIDPEIADRGLSARLMKTVFKGMYQWCLQHEVRYTYMVVEQRLLKVVQRMGWPCRAIGEAVALPPAHALSIGGLLDLDEFRLQAETAHPGMLEWLTTTTPGLGTAQKPSRTENDLEEYGESAEDRQLVRAA